MPFGQGLASMIESSQNAAESESLNTHEKLSCCPFSNLPLLQVESVPLEPLSKQLKEHRAVAASPLFNPSSHCSPDSIFPLPHTGTLTGDPVCKLLELHPGSVLVQTLELPEIMS
ncbi:MAG: hypothetical protein BWY53_00690 [Parcubacteria group bacterium ADurb.Bin326]|nr:MAG: hypothetical protein BWY53_00690 [Parcubacteria group bacterium ADurb.Bin326]